MNITSYHWAENVRETWEEKAHIRIIGANSKGTNVMVKLIEMSDHDLAQLASTCADELKRRRDKVQNSIDSARRSFE